METLQKVALAITIIGAINWGLVGLFDVDIIAAIFGELSMMTRVVQILCGITGLINIGILFTHFE
ncbi:MAG: DUF378 domain-containing protein [Bacilli bacterium]|nr:DUF378 domain-containing protein [Bacilli bacterium]